jgi:hypothetical protein
MHTRWKNCPVAWQGVYRGAKKVPTVALEAICDYNMWFNHVSFGYAGTLNDITILDMSPFMQSLVSGEFSAAELESGMMPYGICGEFFNKMNILVDGIYPQYSRFVKTLREPILHWEIDYCAWQEAARKDIERAFGVFQSKFQYVARPFMELDLKVIGKRVNTCLLLHNMCVSDRVMDADVYARYDPSAAIELKEIVVEHPDDLLNVQGGYEAPPEIGYAEQPHEVRNAMSTRNEWMRLLDIGEHERLHKAIVKKKTGHSI